MVINGITLTPQNILLLASGLLLIIGLFFLILNIRLFIIGRRYQQLMKGTGGQTWKNCWKRPWIPVRESRSGLVSSRRAPGSLIAAQTASLQGLGFVRFNAFSDLGDMSFALALLNKNGDGVVFCCLTGRDDCRLYARQVTGGVSTIPLSNEEKEAIRKALATS